MGQAMMNAMQPRAAGAAPPPIPGAVMFHVAVGKEHSGPFDIGALGRLVTAKQLTRESLVWRDGMAQWAKAGEVPELASLFAGAPPPIPG
jgi:hypothetical protein